MNQKTTIPRDLTEEEKMPEIQRRDQFEQCWNCRFSVFAEEDWATFLLRCFRNAPAPGLISQRQWETAADESYKEKNRDLRRLKLLPDAAVWPLVSPDSYCGQFEADPRCFDGKGER